MSGVRSSLCCASWPHTPRSPLTLTFTLTLTLTLILTLTLTLTLNPTL